MRQKQSCCQSLAWGELYKEYTKGTCTIYFSHMKAAPTPGWKLPRVLEVEPRQDRVWGVEELLYGIK